MTSGDLSAPDAVLFDWDNTLVDSWGCIGEAMNRTLLAMGHRPWTGEEIKCRVALSLRDSFPDLFGTRWEEAREVFYGAFKAIHIDYLKPLPGARKMLETLGALGIRLAVVSNKIGAFLREEAEHLGWLDLFDRLVGATDAPQDKPAPAPVHLTLAAMRRQAGPNTWFVGDAAVDMECARNAACLPILLRREAPRPGEFADNPFRLHLPDCQTLETLVSELSVPIFPI